MSSKLPRSCSTYSKMSASSKITPIDLEELPRNCSTQMNKDSENKNVTMESEKETNPIEAWLPVTESRNGNIWSCIFHLVSSRLGTQALLLPFAFAVLGAWGLTYLSLGFVWQLYTSWVLIHLHETLSSGFRYSRYLQLAMAAFGPKLAKWLCMFPVLYLSGGTCTMLVISGGSTLKLLYEVICSGEGSHCLKNLSTTEWFVIFMCIAFILSQHPNLNSLFWVSVFGTVASILYVSLLWMTTVAKGRVKDVSYDPIFEDLADNLTKFLNTFSAMEMIALSFRGHNLIVEIQGTLPSDYKNPSHKTMWKAVKISNVIVALCFLPLAITGYWAYGNKLTKTGILNTLKDFHQDSGSTTMLGLILVCISAYQLCSFQLYSMLSFDNMELRYVMAKNRPCTWWLRLLMRCLYCFAVSLFLAIAFPFLPSLGTIFGAIGMLVTFAFPCFMYVCIKKPNVREPMFWVNWGLGCLGVVLCVIYFVVAIWQVSRQGLDANFFNAH
ncbi:Lysine histidine transporter-like 7 [Bienertia sinuspersici]